MDSTLQPFSVGLPDPLVLETADAPPAEIREAAVRRLDTHGYALIDAATLAAATEVALVDLQALSPAWDHLPPDEHLKDGGRYRYRRHGSFIQRTLQGEGSTASAQVLEAVPHRAHWQPTTYNALHGGMLRWFAPLTPAMGESAALRGLIACLGEIAGTASLRREGRTGPQRPSAADPWFIEVHPFRIDTAHGVGRPTPEGAHRDGVDYVAVILVSRQGVRGGETRVFQANNPLGLRFTLEAPWTGLLLDDPRVIHESTPILPLSDDPGQAGHRDTLVITYRRGGFQDP
jgi:hypothetical protein